MQLSERLRAVADMVTPGFYLADIGTDHGYIPIDLTASGRIPGAVAADVNPGPLARAQDHIRGNALEDRIETRLSDGLQAFVPGEAESIVIAGMGGALTVKILREGEAVTAKSEELILQPQSEVFAVREYLDTHNWFIDRENMVCEDGKYYPMMHAVHGSSGMPLSKLELCFGPQLLRQRHPLLLQYLRQEEKVQNQILDALKMGSSVRALQREGQVRRMLAQIKEALNIMEEDS